MAETIPPPEHEGGGDWSILGGRFVQPDTTLDRARFEQDYELARHFPDNAVASRYIAAETVTYAFELCSRLTFKENSGVLKAAHKAIAAAAMRDSDTPLSRLEDIVERAFSEGLEETPVGRLLGRIFEEEIVHDREAQIRALAIVVRLAKGDVASLE